VTSRTAACPDRNPASQPAATQSAPRLCWQPETFCDQKRANAPPADALGGNSLALVVGTLRQGEWEASSTTLRHLAAARGVRNFPIVNHGRARGLLHKIRFKLLGVIVGPWNMTACVRRSQQPPFEL
jgi:hypothetical protein